MDSSSIQKMIEDGLEKSFVRIGGSTARHHHLEILVVSDSFEGCSLLDQHRMVMDVLKGPLAKGLHAVELKTMTYAKAQEKGLL